MSKPSRLRAEKPQTCREVLDIITEFLGDRTSQALSRDEQEDLWAVLTALRGPDTQSDKVKWATIQVIRQHAFGCDLGYALFSEDSEGQASYRRKMARRAYGHFFSHAYKAFDVLGLDWDRSNRPVDE